MKKLLICTVLATGLLFGHAENTPVHAGGFPVIDVGNLAQNLLTALQTLEQLENQYQQMQTFGNGAFFNLDNIFGTRGREITNLLNTARGIQGRVNRLKGQYQRMFPDGAQWDNYKPNDYSNFLQQWNNELLDSADDAFRAQQIAHRMQENVAETQRVLSSVNGASGEVRQLQGINQMLSLTNSQLGDVGQSLLSSSRMMATEMTVQASKDKAKRNAASVLRENYHDIGNPRPIQQLP